uniref:cardiolipin synthase n=1 Tax=Alistipes sp. TaxID=1872444 RepID=UPI004056FDDA
MKRAKMQGAVAKSRVRLLNNGDQTYAALLSALQRAREQIHLEYYIFDDDRIGQAISQVLIRRARHGVKVRVIYDLVGSWMPAWGMLRSLRRAGVEVRYFRPLRLGAIWPGLNIRNHRKIALIDNRIAFLGGINIARRYLEGCELGRWRDEHLQIGGYEVAHLEQLFHKDWLQVGGKEYSSREWSLGSFTPSSEVNELSIISSQEGQSRSEVEGALLRLIRSAQSKIEASTPYLIPPRSLREALRGAIKRGVEVRLMIPARVESRIVGWAMESYYEELLEMGVKLYCYKNGFLHTKMVVSDQKRCYIGTANLDYRSLRINWEVGALIKDRHFSRRITRTFEEDLRECRPLTLEAHRQRGPLHRMMNRLARPLSKLL